MGSESAATCRNCEHQFTVGNGGGFRFHLLRCVECGREASVVFDDIEDLHHRYLKGSSQPYTVTYAAEHEYIRDHVDVEPMPRADYFRAVEVAAGACECGGHFTFDAPARCPKCRATDIEEGRITAIYD